MAKIKSFGARVYLNGIAVGGLTDISASGTEVSFVDTTTHNESGGYRTFVGGLKDGGTLELTGRYNYGDAGQAEWKAEEGIKHDFYILLSNNSGLAFQAIVGGFQTTNPLDDAVEFTATAKITGEVFPVFPTITVTGTLEDSNGDPITTPVVFTFDSIENGRPRYESGANSVIAFDGQYWVLEFDSTPSFDSETTELTPDQVDPWTAIDSATGTPTLTGS